MSAPARAVMYALPAVSIALAAAVMLGPGRTRMAVGVRLWGAPAAGGEALSLRIQVARRLLGIDDAAPPAALTVTASAAGTPLGSWTGDAGDDAIAEAWLPAPGGLQAPVAVAVTRNGQPVLDAEIPLGPPPTPPAPPASAEPLPGVAQGELRLTVEIARGALAAPFRGALRVRAAHPDGRPAAAARITARATGAELAGALDGTASLSADADGTAELGVTPRAHLCELTLHASADSTAGAAGTTGATGRWEGSLPVMPGALWLDAAAAGATAAPELRLISPVPRSRAYLSLLGARGRLFGAVVPLAPDAGGFHAGVLLLPRALDARDAPAWAIVAGDPYEQGAGTLAWPLSSAGPAAQAPPQIRLLADGMPAAEARERARAARARRVGLLVLGAAAGAEILLAIALARRARRRLTEHLRDAGAGDAAGDEPLPAPDRARLLAAAGGVEQALWGLTLLALIALAFAAIAALSTFRG